MKMMLLSKTLIIIGCLLRFEVWAHTRLECPPPRSAESGNKIGPCDAPDDPSLEAYPLIPGALNTITWLESISHPGAPARFALSLEGEDAGFESCLLLDHVPHDERSTPSFLDPLSYHRSSITLWIPDVYCERCSLQLITVMSDEFHGVPVNTSCAYSGALDAGKVADPSMPGCPAVYHSCAPVSINGTIPRNEIQECNTTEFEEILDWPFQAGKDYSTYFFKGDPGMYSQTDSRLLSSGAPIKDCENPLFCDPLNYFVEDVLVPDDAEYTSMEGTCAAMVDYMVEPFVLGKLPSVQKPALTVQEDSEDNAQEDNDDTAQEDNEDAEGTSQNPSYDSGLTSNEENRTYDSASPEIELYGSLKLFTCLIFLLARMI